MSKKIFVSTLLVSLTVTLAAILFLRNFRSAPSSSRAGPLSGDEQRLPASVSALTFIDYTGKPIRLNDFVGTPLVVNSWASWCPFCKKEIPDFISLQKKFGNTIKVIAIDRAESRETAKNYSDQFDGGDDLSFLLDPNDSFYQAIGAFSMPETIFVNAQGNIVDHKRGPMELIEMEQRVRNILK